MAKSVHRRHNILALGFIPLLLFGVFFITKQSFSTYRQEQASRELMNNAQEALRTGGKFQLDSQQAIFLNEPVSPLAQALPEPQSATQERVLGESSGEKWIDVDLATQTLKAMEDDHVVYQFLVSTGKWAPTPTGEFAVWSKFKYTKMSGGSKELHDYYYLPNVPFVMFFHDGFAIHGAYWHNNFGHPMSHGCVNVSVPDAEKLFYWANPEVPDEQSMVRSSKDHPGTRVVVHGVPPRD